MGVKLGMAKFGSRTILFSFLLIFALATACQAEYGGGSGTAEQPYLIDTAEQLNEIGLDYDNWNKHFALTADVNLSGLEFNIIGYDEYDPFSGVFDGRGHVISNLSYSTSSSEIGLFGYVSGQNAIIKNTGLFNPFVNGGVSVAPLVGLLEDGEITSCWVSEGYANGHDVVGGIVGDNYGGTVSNCYSDVVVGAVYTAGGIVAKNSGTIRDCYFAGHIYVTQDTTGAITGWDGGGTYIGCFWDESVMGDYNGVGNLEPDPPGVSGETTANMKIAATFVNAGWNVVSPDNDPLINVWRMCQDGLDYPHLAAEFNRCDFACPDGVDALDLAIFAEFWLVPEVDDHLDFSRDKYVDMKDMAMLAAAWYSKAGQENYNAEVDVVFDGEIDEQDLAVFAEYWLIRGSYYLKADLAPYNGDGIVDWRDYAAFASQWLSD